MKPYQVRWPVLMRTIGDLTLVTKTVASLATVSFALKAMREDGLRVISVFEDGEFLGIVTRESLRNAATDMTVGEVVEKLVIEMKAEEPVRSAAKFFVENDLDFVPVVSGGRFIGLLTSNQLLIELGRSWDPMTGLSWSDRLRDWGVNTLESGQEISLAFFDLNNFGEYNKRHGHIVGDRVLKAIARLLADSIQSETDVLVRYGGDEFVIGTVRSRSELQALAREVVSKSLRVEGVPELVTFSVGFSGGKRSKERERTHFASTLDNLINMASRDSLSRKPRKVTIDKSKADTVNVIVDVTEVDSNILALASVTLDGTTALASATNSLQFGMKCVSQSVANAVAKIDPELAVEMMDAVIYKRWDGKTSAIVLVKGQTELGTQEFQGRSSSPEGTYQAVAQAVLDAVQKLRLWNIEQATLPVNQ